MHISYKKSFNIPVSIAFATLAHMINVYEISNYPIFNMQGFIYCLLMVAHREKISDFFTRELLISHLYKETQEALSSTYLLAMHNQSLNRNWIGGAN